MKKYWNIRFTELWASPSKHRKVCDLPAKSVLLDAGLQVGGFTQVVFQATSTLTGWVESIYLEEITYALPYDVVALDHPTASLQDLNQYVFVDGKIQYNLCGELCVCDIAGVPLSTLLALWKAMPTSLYNRVFQNGLARTTGIPDLLNMFAVFANIEILHFNAIFGTPKGVILTPNRLRNVLTEGWKIIMGVRINRSGEIRAAGILHWVAIHSAIAHGVDGGWVDYYNPASNNVESSTWDEFSASMGSPFGLGARTNNDTPLRTA